MLQLQRKEDKRSNHPSQRKKGCQTTINCNQNTMHQWEMQKSCISLYLSYIYSYSKIAFAYAWLEYRRDCQSLTVSLKEQLDLIHFHSELCEALVLCGLTLMIAKRGRPSATENRSSMSLLVSTSPTPTPLASKYYIHQQNLALKVLLRHSERQLKKNIHVKTYNARCTYASFEKLFFLIFILQSLRIYIFIHEHCFFIISNRNT